VTVGLAMWLPVPAMASAAIHTATHWAFNAQVHGRRRMAVVTRRGRGISSYLLTLTTRSAVVSRGTQGIRCAPCLAPRTAVIAGPPCAAHTPRTVASRRMLAGQVADQLAFRAKQTLRMLRNTEAPGLADCLSKTPGPRPLRRTSGPTPLQCAHPIQRWWSLQPGM